MEINDFIPKKRLIVFAACTLVLIVCIVFSYGSLMLSDAVKDITPKIITERGAILDRNGKILAIQTTVYNIAITRSALSSVENTATVLSSIVGMSADAIKRKIMDSPSNFLYLKKKISQGECDAVRVAVGEHSLRGIRLEPVISRTYPENTLASHLIGFMGDEGYGLSGVEYSFQKILSPIIEEGQSKAVGSNVVLTIDSALQYSLEQVAHKAKQSTQAESLVLIVAGAKTGEILSYISLPQVNLNTYTTSTEDERTDRPALYAYEPGSVFKIFSVATFLELDGIKDEDRFYCDGVYDIRSTNGERVRITCLDHHGSITAREALQYSCNDALAQMSEKVNSEQFLSKLRDFGFGSKTGIELPGETRGQLKTTGDRLWSARSKPTISIGQELGVSALQMVQAASAFANNGQLIPLTIISKIVNQAGETTYQHNTKASAQAISADTAALMRSYMESTAKYGTGMRASVGDVPIGVKTGTAQMIDPETGGYSTSDFLSNCIALFPINDPEIILYIVITKAKGETYAGRIVAPVISEAANVIIDMMGFSRGSAPSYVHSGVVEVAKNTPIELKNVIPNMIGTSKRMLTGLLERSDVTIIISGDGYVVSQYPPAGTPVSKGMTIELMLE